MRTSVDPSRVAALLIVALLVGFTIRFNTFAPWATDSGAYLSAAQGWADADVFLPAEFESRIPWVSESRADLPYGFVQGPSRGVMTSAYPLGYAVLLAAAIRIAGPLAAFTVAPLLAGLLAWCAFVLARTLSTGTAGVVAALLVAATPVTLYHAVLPMSDVPATAFWALAWVMALRPGAGALVAAGCATAMAIAIRPNLAPLALVVVATIAASGRAGTLAAIRRVALFTAVAATGPLLVFWSQAVLYGSALQSGYRVPLTDFFNTERIPVNARLYPAMLWQLHSGIAFLGLVFVPVAVMRARLGERQRHAAIVACGAAGMIAINYALYLAYLTYEGWLWLRFMLPAMLALFVLLAALLEELRRTFSHWRRWAGPVALVPALVVVLLPRDLLGMPMGYLRLQLMGRYLREALPPRAVILTATHGGALLNETGRPVINLGHVAPDGLDRLVSDLARGGYRPVYVLDIAVEGAEFAEKFRGSPLARLAWPARAQFASATSINYWDLSDRTAFLNGERWMTDVLLEPPHPVQRVDWDDFRLDNERVTFPVETELLSFRTRLETVYERDLSRTPTPVNAAPRDALSGTRRYLRYRLHGCDHARATANVLRHLDDDAVAPLCARPGVVLFPPRNETVAFRHDLESAMAARGGRGMTAVDLEGEAVWLQHYLELRVVNCPHTAAIDAVIAAILGTAAPMECAAR